jgi:hypothetical protein
VRENKDAKAKDLLYARFTNNVPNSASNADARTKSSISARTCVFSSVEVLAEFFGPFFQGVLKVLNID